MLKLCFFFLCSFRNSLCWNHPVVVRTFLYLTKKAFDFLFLQNVPIIYTMSFIRFPFTPTWYKIRVDILRGNLVEPVLCSLNHDF